jgi:hypothetical protein
LEGFNKKDLGEIDCVSLSSASKEVGIDEGEEEGRGEES